MVGVNIGKNAVTPLDRAIDDYIFCLRKVFTVADYVTVNVSSPNTAGLRSLQDVDHLVPLLSGILEESRVLESRHSRRVPLLVKLSPDLTEDELRKSAKAAASVPVAGIIATNTTITRESVSGHALASETGGLSGRPLFAKSCAAIRILQRHGRSHAAHHRRRGCGIGRGRQTVAPGWCRPHPALYGHDLSGPAARARARRSAALTDTRSRS